MLSSSPLEAFHNEPISKGTALTSSPSPAQNVFFLLRMADKFERDGNITESVKSAETALLMRKAMSDEACVDFPEPMHKQALSLIQKCNGMAVGEFQSSRYDTALFLLNKALFLSSAAADTNCFGMHEHDRLRLRAATLNNLGCLEKRRENIREALDYLQSAVEIETLVDSDVGASPSTCLNLCTLFNRVGRHDEAVAAAERAISALHFQSQQGHDNMPQYVNMLMVAYYNLGVSVECAAKAGCISKAIDAYSRTVDIHHEHGGGLQSATCDSATEALRRLRAQQVEYPVARLGASTDAHVYASQLPPIRRPGESAPRPAIAQSLAKLAPMASANVPTNFDAGRAPKPPAQSFTAPAPPRPFVSSLQPALSGVRQRDVSAPLVVAESTPRSKSTPRRPSLSTITGTAAVLESAAYLGDATMKHASRMQAKARRREEASERAALALVKAKRAHRRDKESQQRRDEEHEARRRDDMAAELYTRMVDSMRAEEVRRAQHAVCRITAVWRGYITRKYILILTHCVIRIQALVRSALCRIRLAAEKEEARQQEVSAAINFRRMKAAMVIQLHARRFIRRLAIIRRYKARKLREFYSARRIQVAYRLFCHRRQEAVFQRIEAERIVQQQEQARIDAAACRIQGMYRSFKLRRFARLVRSEQQRRVDAAICIQSQIRGCLARQWFKHYRLFRREQEMNSDASIRSITRIQRAWRVALAKRHLAVLRAESIVRMRNTRIHRSAIIIQCAFRCFVARSVMHPLRARRHAEEQAALAIQAAFRGFTARQMYRYQAQWRRRQAAAAVIQRWVRAVHQRVKDRSKRREGFQMRLAERAALRRTGAAMCIQTFCYSFLSLGVFSKALQRHLHRTHHAIILQSAGRRYLASRDMVTLQRISALVLAQEMRHAEMNRAAFIIQKRVRSYQAKSILEDRRARQIAAVRVQSVWRMHCARLRVAHVRMELQQAAEERALAVLQRAGRRYLRHEELRRLEAYHLAHHRQKMLRLRREEAATQIQSLWRGVATRNAVTEAKRRLMRTVIETMRIQRAWRCYTFRRSINAHIHRAVSQRQRQFKAAARIQAFWRMVLAKEYVSYVREQRFYHTVCAITIQNAWRAFTARAALVARKQQRDQRQQFLAIQHDGWVQAVTTIAAHARSLLDQRLRLVLIEARLRERVHQRERARAARLRMAATCIQSHYRGYYERTYVRGLRKEKAERDAAAALVASKRNRAALAIQCAYRCMVARMATKRRRVERRIESESLAIEKAMSARPEDVVRSLFWQHESMLKKNIQRTQAERHERIFAAARTVQSVVRMYLARRAFRAELGRRARLAAHAQHEAELLARTEEQRVATEALRNSSALRIQAAVRAFLVRKRFSNRSAPSKAMAVCDEELRDAAATRIQSAWRGYSARILAETLARARNDAIDAVSFYEAARLIQKFFRGHRVRVRLGTVGVVRRRLSAKVGQIRRDASPTGYAAPPAALY